MRPTWFFWLMVTVLSMLVQPHVYAHKLEADARIQEENPNVLVINAHYDDGTPAESAHIEFTSEQGTNVHTGLLNEQGRAEIPRPRAGKYRIVVRDDAGHRVSLNIDIPQSHAELAQARTEQRNRWLMIVLGLVIIGGGTTLIWWLRKPKHLV